MMLRVSWMSNRSYAVVTEQHKPNVVIVISRMEDSNTRKHSFQEHYTGIISKKKAENGNITEDKHAFLPYT